MRCQALWITCSAAAEIRLVPTVAAKPFNSTTSAVQESFVPAGSGAISHVAFDADLRADPAGRHVHRRRLGPMNFAEHDRHAQRAAEKGKAGADNALQRALVDLFGRHQVGNRRRKLVQIGKQIEHPLRRSRQRFFTAECEVWHDW